MTTTSSVRYDPYDIEINSDPYPVFRRLREEAPLYYNEQHDFYAREPVRRRRQGARDWETYSSAEGGILELIQAGIEMPPGVFIFEDPPIHSMHRGLLSRVFTPRKMNALEPKLREFCARSLDPLVGADRLRLHRRPRAADADAGHRHAARHPRGRPGGGPRPGRREPAHRGGRADGDPTGRLRQTATIFEEYIDWRARTRPTTS